MDAYTESGRWPIYLFVIATFGIWPLQGSHATETDAQNATREEPAEATQVTGPTEDASGEYADSDEVTPLEPADVATPANDTKSDDAGSGLTAPAESADTWRPTAVTSGDGKDSGLGLTPPKSATNPSSPTGDKAIDEATKEQLAWEAFYPPPDTEFDWIQLASGEWLKGELKTVYDYQMEFDSDELGLLKIDLEDKANRLKSLVAALQSTPELPFDRTADKGVLWQPSPETSSITKTAAVAVAVAAAKPTQAELRAAAALAAKSAAAIPRMDRALAELAAKRAEI